MTNEKELSDVPKLDLREITLSGHAISDEHNKR